MMVFRLHGDELVFGGAVHPVQPQIPQMKMMKVHIPFTFKLQDSCRSSHSGESCDLLALILGSTPIPTFTNSLFGTTYLYIITYFL
jgi:hypothetical protein